MASHLNLTVLRQNPVLVPPSLPTPYELKLLSDIDDQEGLRFQIQVIQFYRNNPLIRGQDDPVLVIKEALGKALVHYYPFAGRVREAAGRKLVVECTGEGILFVEAEANARLEDFGESPQPPFPHLSELLFDVEGSGDVINTPLLLIQVTRLLCGGFILAVRQNHTISDATGFLQFLMAVAELARGAPHPSVKPIWKRELLSARSPPRVTCFHREHEEVSPGNDPPLVDFIENSIFFGPKEIKNIRDHHLPAHLRNRPTFEIVTACLWKCRTAAIRPDYPDEEVRIMCVVNARSKFNPPIPLGYYGNAIAFSAASATADKLCRNPLGYALEKVKKAKSAVTEEYMRSLADLLVLRNKPSFTVARSYLVSDVTRAGFETVDFGWGPAVYGGPATAGVGVPGLGSFYIPAKNADGEKGMVVPICLPAAAMDKFVTEIEKYTKEPGEESNKISQFVSFAKSKI